MLARDSERIVPLSVAPLRMEFSRNFWFKWWEVLSQRLDEDRLSLAISLNDIWFESSLSCDFSVSLNYFNGARDCELPTFTPLVVSAYRRSPRFLDTLSMCSLLEAMNRFLDRAKCLMLLCSEDLLTSLSIDLTWFRGMWSTEGE